jgi:vacuolar-type H+-ATPase subunit F/Vma7
VVFVTEPVYSAIDDLVREVSDRPFPAVTVIPGAGSGGGIGQAKLDRAIERALGTTVPVRVEEA